MGGNISILGHYVAKRWYEEHIIEGKAFFYVMVDHGLLLYKDHENSQFICRSLKEVLMVVWYKKLAIWNWFSIMQEVKIIKNIFPC
jgi:hypothetical protein